MTHHLQRSKVHTDKMVQNNGDKGMLQFQLVLTTPSVIDGAVILECEDHPKVNTNYEHGMKMKMKMKMIHGGRLELTRPINKLGGKQSWYLPLGALKFWLVTSMIKAQPTEEMLVHQTLRVLTPQLIIFYFCFFCERHQLIIQCSHYCTVNYHSYSFSQKKKKNSCIAFFSFWL